MTLRKKLKYTQEQCDQAWLICAIAASSGGAHPPSYGRVAEDLGFPRKKGAFFLEEHPAVTLAYEAFGRAFDIIPEEDSFTLDALAAQLLLEGKI